MTKKNNDGKKILVELESKLESIFLDKLPALPDKAKELIVKYGPYVAVVFLVISIPMILTLIGIGVATTGLVSLAGARSGFGYIISIVFGLVMMVLEIMAIKGLFKRQKKAWKLLFYISLIQAVLNILRFDLGGLIIGTGISWYILFQIKSYYKN